MTDRYMKMVRALLSEFRGDDNDVNYDLLDAARECDRLEGRLVEHAKYMARKYEEFAKGCAMGRYYNLPSGYSTAAEVDADASAIRARLDSLSVLVRIVLGDEAQKAFVKAAGLS